MKKKLFLILTICICVVLLSLSCRQNYRMITVFDKDGSFQKTFYTKTDSAFFEGDMSKNPFLFDIDSCWSLSYQSAEETGFSDKKTLVHIAKISRKFKSIDEFNTLQFHEKTRSLANPTESFSKKFRWFFTYYSFSAEYKQFAYNIPISPDSYMTKEEQSIWFQGDMSKFAGWNGYEIKEKLDEIEKNFGKWYAKYYFEISFNSISYVVQNQNIKYFEQMQEFKDSLFQINFKNIKDNSFEISDLIAMLDTFFKTKDFTRLYNDFGEEMEKYSKQFSYEEILTPMINYELIIPGKITETNASVISGDTLKWQVDLLRILPSDYILTANSRSLNLWTFILTGLLLIISGICFVIVKK